MRLPRHAILCQRNSVPEVTEDIDVAERARRLAGSRSRPGTHCLPDEERQKMFQELAITRQKNASLVAWQRIGEDAAERHGTEHSGVLASCEFFVKADC